MSAQIDGSLCSEFSEGGLNPILILYRIGTNPRTTLPEKEKKLFPIPILFQLRWHTLSLEVWLLDLSGRLALLTN